jgi:hypothetical protein
MKEATRFTSFSTIRFHELTRAPWVVLVLGFMCNGANFAYTKSLFEDLSGLMEIIRLRSGDDVFYKKLLPNILKKSII